MARTVTIELTEDQARMLWTFCCAGMGELEGESDASDEQIKTSHEVEEKCREAVLRFDIAKTHK
jgi:hypothetical protein